MQGIDRREIEALIPAVDYSEALTITASPTDVREACLSARRYGFRSLAAFPQYVGLVAEELKALTRAGRRPVCREGRRNGDRHED